MRGFMVEAIRLAREKMVEGAGGPFGAVVVRDGAIVSRGHNQVLSALDPTAHAEMVAIRDACRQLGRFHLEDCELVSSCEPCPMCLGAVYWARLRRVCFAATREDAAGAGFDDTRIYREMELPPPKRSIPMVQLMREDALEVFRAWREKEDRVEY